MLEFYGEKFSMSKLEFNMKHSPKSEV